MDELTEGDRQLLSDIQEYGWHVVKVMADGTEPGFSYSIGIYKSLGLPEIVIVGLPSDLAHQLINLIGSDLKKGKSYQSGDYYDDIIENYKCYMLEVEKSRFKEYFGYGTWYYKGDNFPVLQCIYPSKDNIYPWDWPEGERGFQPLLGYLK